MYNFVINCTANIGNILPTNKIMSNILPTIKERVLYLAVNVEDNKQIFFKKIGISYNNFTGEKKKRPLNSNAIRNILLTYPQTNAEWLLTGNGNMLKKKEGLINSGNYFNKSIKKNRNVEISNNVFDIENSKDKLMIEFLYKEIEYLKNENKMLIETIKDKNQIIQLLNNK